MTGLKEYQRRIAGGYAGSAYFTKTAPINFNFDQIVILGDTQIAEIYIEGMAGNQIKAGGIEEPYNFLGVTLTSSFPPIHAPEGKRFTKIVCSTNGGIMLRHAP